MSTTGRDLMDQGLGTQQRLPKSTKATAWPTMDSLSAKMGSICSPRISTKVKPCSARSKSRSGQVHSLIGASVRRCRQGSSGSLPQRQPGLDQLAPRAAELDHARGRMRHSPAPAPATRKRHPPSSPGLPAHTCGGAPGASDSGPPQKDPLGSAPAGTGVCVSKIRSRPTQAIRAGQSDAPLFKRRRELLRVLW